MERPRTLHVDKPWGSFDQYVLNGLCTVKILTCRPSQRLSLQRHRHRSELWIALDAGVIIELDGRVITPDKGAEVWLPAGSVHRLSCSAQTAHAVRVMEISFGTFDENDIERLEDIYGRA